MARAWRAVRCLAPSAAVLLALGCFEPPDGGREAPQEDVSRHLQALGYVALDGDADRAVAGVVWHARERVSPGLNLFTNDVDAVLLVDAEGREVRRWTLPGRKHCEYAELISGPRLAVVCEREALVVIEPDGAVALEIRADVHHDVAERPDGSLLVPVRGEPAFYRGRKVVFDSLLEVATDGTTRVAWSSRDAVESLRPLHGPGELDSLPGPLRLAKNALLWILGRSMSIHEYYHLNSVEVLEESALGGSDDRFRAGHLLLGLRNANVAAVVDAESGDPLWVWGQDQLDLPHMPTLLSSGHLLVFDNGTQRGWTRIVEVEPRSGRVTWQYPERPDPGFFSEWRGGVQRLPNGNTLVCMSEEGRVLELTREGELVWEFWNPDVSEAGRKRIYRFTRIPQALATQLLAESGDREEAEPAP